jgi:hypothetical protein
MNPREAGQKGLVWIFLAHANFHGDIVFVEKRLQVGVLPKEAFHGVAPAAPFAAHDNEDVFVRAFCFFANGRQVSVWGTLGIVAIGQCIVGRGGCYVLNECFALQ